MVKTIPDKCVDGAEALSEADIKALMGELDGAWEREGTAKISRDVQVKDFQAGLDLVNRIGAAAEEENHHPDLLLHGYQNVRVSLSTHDAGGLTGNDFVMARRADAAIAAG